MFSDKIILTDKPLDWTSTDVVRYMKKKLDVKKIGHAGTLDPRATGLLILCTGKMTKRINDFMDTDKEYQGIIRIGARTKSFDTESEEEEIRDTSKINESEIENLTNDFIGEQMQMPPIFSAIKQNGKPVYKLARKGENVILDKRKIFIKKFVTKRINDTEVYFDVICSKGTYIRSLANDFGEKLGVGGYLKELKRTKIGDFKLEVFPESAGEIRYKIL